MYLERLFVIALFLTARGTAAEPPRTEIMKWQDGKDACISLTSAADALDVVQASPARRSLPARRDSRAAISGAGPGPLQ